MGIEVRESTDRRLASLYREMRDGGVFWFGGGNGKMFGGLNKVDSLVITSGDYYIQTEVVNCGAVKATGEINKR